MRKAVFGAGCFWHVQEAFDNVKGVTKTVVGFMGGKNKNPTYKQVCYENTGHAEVTYVEYDEKKVSYKKLLELFWKIHNPTTKNRQGLDFGEQYRSVIFYYTKEQRDEAIKSLEREEKRIGKKIVTQVEKASEFYPAEDYHQNYYLKNKRVC
ncbi:MAG: peptide-methionine (S)-S-oxide reductase MsrA [Nanoarchaeota archaeon]|nr:peptide-methionine (S)-S-oxide reductase MsrA [Nanoarchaeota archaeon]